jgi:serine/threonine-protein phosphatase 2A regulatory subunit A
VVVEKQFVLSDLLPMYRAMSVEETQDSVRIACVQASLALTEMFTEEENRLHTVLIVRAAVEDRSWRVRLVLTRNFDRLCQALGADLIAQYIIQPFSNLLRDNELDVRQSALAIVEKCLEMISNEQLIAYIIPAFPLLAADPVQSVRGSLAQLTIAVAGRIGRENTQKLLLPLVLDLLKDDFHNVRLNVVCGAGHLCEVLGLEVMVQSLLASVQSLIMDNQWRIRLAVIEQIPRLDVLLF